MKKMKKTTAGFLSVLLLAACGANEQGMKNRPEDTDITENMSVRNITYYDNKSQGHNQSRLHIADEAESRVEQLDDVREATVIVTDQNAYVAVVLEGKPKGEGRKNTENRIADKVRDADQGLQNVYVSSNPDFVNRLNDFRSRLQSGQPAGLLEEFHETVQRVFPNRQ